MAYAAVTSLMGTLYLHFLQSQPRFPLQHKQKMVSLYENLGFLQEILEKSEIAYDNAAMKDLEAEIRDVSFKAEERIEMELTTIYLAKGWTKHLRIKACLLRLHGIFTQAVKQTDYLKDELIRVKSEYHLAKGSSQNQERASLHGSTSSQPNLERENIRIASKFDSRMVGCDKEFMTILDQLTLQSTTQRRVVAIVGMGGIGKTTLAGKVYEDTSIVSHFDMRAWITVSQDYNTRQMLRCLSGCVIAASDELQEESYDQDQLAESLYKRLKGQRYLIVIDDIWSTTAWDNVQRCFPDDNNGSRILLTSRIKEVGEYASSGSSPLNMCLLDVEESWNLYCKVFGKTEFLFAFEHIGRYIVKKCKGLPLAIIVVASLLSKTEEVVEKWKNVAENVSKFVIGDSNDECSRILSLSYSQLPHHLKACFLYFGVFPEDCEIPVKKLVRLWMAEGSLRSVKHRNLEEMAIEYLQDLVDRSLVIVSKQSYNGKIKTIRIHDLLRELCLREARHENLLREARHAVVGLENLPFYKRKSQHLFSKPCHWIGIRPRCFNDPIMSQTFIKSSSFDFNTKVFSHFSHFKLLRVIDMEVKFGKGGVEVLNALANLAHLRYLEMSTREYLRPLNLKLFELWNMQSFIVHGCGILDSSQAYGIWKMPLLRNLYLDIILSLETLKVVHRNLETIFWLGPECCTKGLFTMIPNLKKLGILGRFYYGNSDCFYNFVHLEQLEKLSIREWHLKRIPCSGIPWETSFLPNLKKLNFCKTGLLWNDMRLIGMLPNLEVLKLINAITGLTWEPSEGGFRRLKKLVVEKTYLKYWIAMDHHFPVLECLELDNCYLLQVIPSGFADITTLALIQLNHCCDSLLASANWIQDAQHNYGNHSFFVRSKNIWEGRDEESDE